MENNNPGTLTTKSQENNTKQAIFIHRCCNDGYKFFKQFSIEHPEALLKSYSMLVARDMGLPQLYGFNLNDLHSYTFIWYENKLLKGNI
jgi:hypothetical protein